MKTNPFLTVLTAGTLLLAASPAPAQDDFGLTNPVQFEREDAIFEDVSLDTDWQPPGEAIQVRFIVKLGDTVSGSLPGEAGLVGEPPALRFAGEQDGGSFGMNLGVEVQCLLRFTLDVPAVGEVSWEGEIPFVPSFDYRLQDETRFTPFLLPGSPDRPASVRDSVDRKRLIEQDLAGSLIPIPGISGGIAVDVVGELTGTLAGERITVGEEIIDTEGGSIELAWSQDGTIRTACAYDSTLGAQVTLTFYPTVFIEIAFSEYTLAEFPLPIQVPPVDTAWPFAGQDLSFRRGTPDGGVPDGGNPDGSSANDSDGSGNSEGCGCGSGGTAKGALCLLLPLGWLAARRRRPTADEH